MVIVVLAIVVVGVWVWKLGGSAAPATGEETGTPTSTESMPEGSTTLPAGVGDDTTGDIQGQLEGIDTGSVQDEFQQIDEQLNNL